MSWDFNTQKFSNFINIQILKGMIKLKMNYDNQCQNARVSMLLKIKWYWVKLKRYKNIIKKYKEL